MFFSPPLNVVCKGRMFKKPNAINFQRREIYENVSGFFFFLNRVKVVRQTTREAQISLDLCARTNKSTSNTNTGCIICNLPTKLSALKIIQQ
jgi:hypothetical protein